MLQNEGKKQTTLHITCMFHQTILIYSEVQRNLKKFETDVFHMNSTRGDWVMGLLTLPYNLVFVDQRSTNDPIWNLKVAFKKQKCTISFLIITKSFVLLKHMR